MSPGQLSRFVARAAFSLLAATAALPASAAIVTYNFTASNMGNSDLSGDTPLATVMRAFSALNATMTGSFSYDTASAPVDGTSGATNTSAEYRGLHLTINGFTVAGESFSSVVGNQTVVVLDIAPSFPYFGVSSAADNLRQFGRPELTHVSDSVRTGFTFLSFADYVTMGPTQASGLTSTALPASLDLNSFSEASFLIFELTDGTDTGSFMYRIDALSLETAVSAQPTLASIIQTFLSTGTLPTESIPGVFELPDAVTSAITTLAELLKLLFPAQVPPAAVELGDGSLFDDVAVVEGQPIVFDPAVAVGYVYEIRNAEEEGVYFMTVMAPTVGGDTEYLLTFLGAGGVESVVLAAGETFAFDAQLQLSRFVLSEIDAAAALDPADGLAFPTVISFTGSGTIDLIQTPIVMETDDPVANVPEPASALLVALEGAAAAWGTRWRRRRATPGRSGFACRCAP